MLITYRSLLLAIVVILQLSFCLGHDDTTTTQPTHQTHHSNRPTPTTTSRHHPHHYKHGHGHKKIKTLCTTKTFHLKGTSTRHHHQPTTTVHCSTKVVWIHPTHHHRPKHNLHQKHRQTEEPHKTTTHKVNDRKKTTNIRSHTSTHIKSTTTSKHIPKPTTTTTAMNDGKKGMNQVNAFSEANVSTPTATIQDPNELTPTTVSATDNNETTPDDDPNEEIPDPPEPISNDAEPTRSSITPPAAAPAATPVNGSDPNDATIETQSVKNDGSTNTSLGLGLGLGVGCVAAVGLVGLLVHTRRNNQAQDQMETTADNDDPTRWRPQSFMGVVASVVAKLPRSPSQRTVNTGMAVGSGQGAVELPPSQPPDLARIPQYQY